MRKTELMKWCVLPLIIFPFVLMAETFSDSLHQAYIASFDTVWSKIAVNHYDENFNGVDWPGIRDALRPQMEQVQTRQGARKIIRAMIDSLHLSHFGLISSEVYEDMNKASNERFIANPGMEIRIVNDQVLVTKVYPGFPADSAGITPGFLIYRIQGDTVSCVIEKVKNDLKEQGHISVLINRYVSNLMTGLVGDTLRLDLINGENEIISRELILKLPRGKEYKMGYLPAFYVWLEVDTLDHGIGYVAFNAFMDPMGLMNPYGAAVTSFKEAPGLIIDLRGNPGGIIGMGMGMAGWFIKDKGQKLGTMITRNNQLKFVVNPRLPHFDKPLAILIDAQSGSTSEFFASGLKDLGRARIFGETSAGAALPSIIISLPSGDGFQFATANYKSKSGLELEGNGVTPDEIVHPDRKQLLKGIDPVKEAAIKWIIQQSK